MTGARNRHPSDRPDTLTDRVVGGTIGRLFSFILWFVFAVVVSILIEWTGMLLNWWDRSHARNMLMEEISCLSQLDQNLLIGLHPAALASTGVERLNSAYSWLGVNHALERISGIELLHTAVTSALDISYLLVIRLATVVLAIPAFILWGLVALVDGLVARDIRRACGGLESSFVYHRVKRWLSPSIMVSAGLYLTLPITLDPAIFFLLPQLLFFGAVYYTAATFKKFI